MFGEPRGEKSKEFQDLQASSTALYGLSVMTDPHMLGKFPFPSLRYMRPLGSAQPRRHQRPRYDMCFPLCGIGI